MPREKPQKTELARFKVMNDSGLSPNAIGKRTGRDPKTVRKYLASDVYFDPEINSLVNLLKEKEIEDLIIITGKTRAALNNYLDQVLDGEKQPNPIAICAIQDRCFTQRQLLEGKPTENISVHSVVHNLQIELEKLQREIDELDGVEGEEDE